MKAIIIVFSLVLCTGMGLIEKYEGFSAIPYIDSAGKQTIGFGFRDPNRSKIDRKTAEHELSVRVNELSNKIRVLLPNLRVNQQAALVSFAYNVGWAAFLRSKVYEKARKGDHFGAANELLKWTRVGKRHLRGLMIRRLEERELYLR